MLSQGDWRSAERFLFLLQGVHPESKHFINGAMMDLLESVLDPLYYVHFEEWTVLASAEWVAASKAKRAAFKPLDARLAVTELKALPSIMGPMIAAINLYLHRRPILYGKVCRILTKVMDAMDDGNGHGDGGDDPDVAMAEEEEVEEDSTLQIVENVMYDLLSAYSLMEGNPGISKELWRILSRLSFDHFWRM